MDANPQQPINYACHSLRDLSVDALELIVNRLRGPEYFLLILCGSRLLNRKIGKGSSAALTFRWDVQTEGLYRSSHDISFRFPRLGSHPLHELEIQSSTCPLENNEFDMLLPRSLRKLHLNFPESAKLFSSVADKHTDYFQHLTDLSIESDIIDYLHDPASETLPNSLTRLCLSAKTGNKLSLPVGSLPPRLVHLDADGVAFASYPNDNPTIHLPSSLEYLDLCYADDLEKKFATNRLLDDIAGLRSLTHLNLVPSKSSSVELLSAMQLPRSLTYFRGVLNEKRSDVKVWVLELPPMLKHLDLLLPNDYFKDHFYEALPLLPSTLTYLSPLIASLDDSFDNMKLLPRSVTSLSHWRIENYNIIPVLPPALTTLTMARGQTQYDEEVESQFSLRHLSLTSFTAPYLLSAFATTLPTTLRHLSFDSSLIWTPALIRQLPRLTSILQVATTPVFPASLIPLLPPTLIKLAVTLADEPESQKLPTKLFATLPALTDLKLVLTPTTPTFWFAHLPSTLTSFRALRLQMLSTMDLIRISFAAPKLNHLELTFQDLDNNNIGDLFHILPRHLTSISLLQLEENRDYVSSKPSTWPDLTHAQLLTLPPFLIAYNVAMPAPHKLQCRVFIEARMKNRIEQREDPPNGPKGSPCVAM